MACGGMRKKTTNILAEESYRDISQRTKLNVTTNITSVVVFISHASTVVYHRSFVKWMAYHYQARSYTQQTN